MSILQSVSDKLARAAISVTKLDIPDIKADYDAPFLDLGKKIVSWILAGGTIVAVAVVVIAIILLATGALGDRHKEKGWIALLVGLAAAALLGSVTALVAWAGNLVLV